MVAAATVAADSPGLLEAADSNPSALHPRLLSTFFPSDLAPPQQWQLAADISAEAVERAVAIAQLVARQDSTPFRAGLLSQDRIAAAFPAGFSLDLPPIPLTLAAIADPSAAFSDLPTAGRRRRFDADAAPLIEKCLASGALRRLRAAERPLGWAPLFSVLSSHKTRLIFDLRAFNACLSDPAFVMETLLDLPALAAGCVVGGKLDCKSAYFQYPIHPQLQSFMCCTSPLTGETLAWTVLPFGLSHAPGIWTRLLANFVRLWRSQGIVVLAYIDDIILLAPSTGAFLQHSAIIVRDLLAAGIRLSADKYFLAPLSRFEALGLLVDLTARGFIIPDSRLHQISTEAEAILNLARSGQEVSAKAIEVLLGRITFAALACPWLAFYRAHLIAAISPLIVGDSIPVDATVALVPDAVEELQWWSTAAPSFLSGRVWPWDSLASTRIYAKRGLAAPFPLFVAASDASATGIGFSVLGSSMESEPLPPDLGPASPSCSRELYGLARCIETGDFDAGAVIRLLTDAQAAMFTWCSPSVAPSTARYARRLFEAALERDVIVQLEWTPRWLLEPWDAGSRIAERDMAHATVPRMHAAALVAEAFGDGAVVDAEFFASAAAATFPRAPRGSRLPDPAAPLGDGMSAAAWRTCKAGWAFPPFALARTLAARVAAMPRAPAVVLLLPDIPIIRFVLRTWRSRDGPTYLYAPPTFSRRAAPPVPLRAFLPPLQVRSVVPSVSSAVATSPV